MLRVWIVSYALVCACDSLCECPGLTLTLQQTLSSLWVQVWSLPISPELYTATLTARDTDGELYKASVKHHQELCKARPWTRTHARTHAHTRAHTHTHTHTHTHARARTRTRTHARTHTHTRTHARTHTHTHFMALMETVKATHPSLSSPLGCVTAVKLSLSCREHSLCNTLSQNKIHANVFGKYSLELFNF